MKRKETGFFARLRTHMPDRFQKTIFWITVLLFISNVVSAILADEQQDVSRFIFSAFSCFGMLVVIALPALATRFFRVKIPRVIQLIYVVFAFCGIVLGYVINFFDRFKYWDAILHFISGVLLASLGFILINTLNKADSVSLRISPVYVAVSVVCFAVTGGVLWEIVEYCFDDLFGTNMQTYLDSTTGSLVDENAVYLVGHEALKDTMWDLMLDAAGAIIVAVYGFIELKHEKKGMTTAAFEFENDPEKEPAESEKAPSEAGEIASVEEEDRSEV